MPASSTQQFPKEAQKPLSKSNSSTHQFAVPRVLAAFEEAQHSALRSDLGPPATSNGYTMGICTTPMQPLSMVDCRLPICSHYVPPLSCVLRQPMKITHAFILSLQYNISMLFNLCQVTLFSTFVAESILAVFRLSRLQLLVYRF
jgi:hypothetical protein